MQRPPNEVFPQHRQGDPRLGEWVESLDSIPSDKDHRPVIVLYGCPDDTGVLLNRGRKGAAEGPDSIRKYLYKMALPMDLEIEKVIRLIDLGNILVGKQIEDTHLQSFDVAKQISQTGATLIALGGGHDFAAPNFLGWESGGRAKPAGLINIDPHLDVRPLESGVPNSGTPFRVILESKQLAGRHFTEFGTRSNRNAREHFDYVKKKGVRVMTLESLRQSKTAIEKEFSSVLKALATKVGRIAITIDIDSCSDGEGSSAAPVIGFSANELYSISAFAGAHKKVSYFEIAEVAPPLDLPQRTSRISAELIFSFLYARAKSLIRK